MCRKCHRQPHIHHAAHSLSLRLSGSGAARAPAARGAGAGRGGAGGGRGGEKRAPSTRGVDKSQSLWGSYVPAPRNLGKG